MSVGVQVQIESGSVFHSFAEKIIRDRIKAMGSCSRFTECQNIISVKIMRGSLECKHIFHTSWKKRGKHTFQPS